MAQLSLASGMYATLKVAVSGFVNRVRASGLRLNEHTEARAPDK